MAKIVRLRGYDVYGLKERRRAACLTQLELADMTGIPNSTISYMEHGQRASGPRVRALAKALKCKTSDLITPPPAKEIDREA